MKGDCDARLVQIKGRLVSQDLLSEFPTLALSSGGTLFMAILPNGTKAGETASWRLGSELKLTGVCLVQVDKSLSAEREGAALPKSFRILLRSPRDIVVREEPSWWTMSRILVLLAICVLSIFFGALWVVALNGHVREFAEAEQRIVSAGHGCCGRRLVTGSARPPTRGKQESARGKECAWKEDPF
jgi:hypothetical protein